MDESFNENQIIFTPRHTLLGAFSAYDIHKSGSADYAEIRTGDLRNVLRLLGHILSQEELNRLIEDADVKRKGRISFLDFYILMISVDIKAHKRELKRLRTEMLEKMQQEQQELEKHFEMVKSKNEQCEMKKGEIDDMNMEKGKYAMQEVKTDDNEDLEILKGALDLLRMKNGEKGHVELEKCENEQEFKTDDCNGEGSGNLE